jgi:hypothetical protein
MDEISFSSLFKAKLPLISMSTRPLEESQPKDTAEATQSHELDESQQAQSVMRVPSMVSTTTVPESEPEILYSDPLRLPAESRSGPSKPRRISKSAQQPYVTPLDRRPGPLKDNKEVGSPRQPGNNKFGNRGTAKCSDCRRLKQKVIHLLSFKLTF